MTPGLLLALWLGAAPGGRVELPAGSYEAFLVQQGQPPADAGTPLGRVRIPVPAFRLDPRPVTQAEFLAFVRAHPRWRRSQVPRLFAEKAYLAHWEGELKLGQGVGPQTPVTGVSWFAARAYCRWKGGRLPTVDEWEYAASPASPEEGKVNAARVLTWYARPASAPLPVAGAGPANRFGVRDLHGVIWEWTADFSAAMTNEDGRDGSSAGGALVCGGAGAAAADPSDYASFMRYAFRSSLQPTFTMRTLGFRCAEDATSP